MAGRLKESQGQSAADRGRFGYRLRLFSDGKPPDTVGLRRERRVGPESGAGGFSPFMRIAVGGGGRLEKKKDCDSPPQADARWLTEPNPRIQRPIGQRHQSPQ